MADSQHSPAPWKLAVTGNVWGLQPKGFKPQDGEADVAQGSTYSECWPYDAALIQAAPTLLAALQQLVEAPSDPDAVKAAKAAIRKATKPAT